MREFASRDDPESKSEGRTADEKRAPEPGGRLSDTLGGGTAAGGEPLDARVRRPAERALGGSLGSVRVHANPQAQRAAGEREARAFTYGRDVFLARGQSPLDVHLMAHELAHVKQQKAAGRLSIQRQAEGEVPSDAEEREAEAAADAATSEATGDKANRIVIPDGEKPGAGQMTRSVFLAQLKTAVEATATDVLGPLWDVAGCPYIKAWFEQHSEDPADALEGLARRYSQGASATAAGTIQAIAARVHEGIVQWSRGVSVGGEAAAAGVDEGRGALLTVQGWTRDGGALRGDRSAPRVLASLGPGRPIDRPAAARIGGSFGADLSGVRVHTDARAARFAEETGTWAFTVGSHIGFSRGTYRPGTIAGDVLLAHELAHVVQQRGAESGATAPSPAQEGDADRAAAGFLSDRLGRASLPAGGRPRLRTGLALQGCKKKEPIPEKVPPPPIQDEKELTHGRMKWHLQPAGNSSATMDIEFIPNAATAKRIESISFIQTVIFKRAGKKQYSDYGGGPEYEERTGRRVDFVREPTLMPEDFDPFYGANWDDGGQRWKGESEKSKPWQRPTAGGGTGTSTPGAGAPAKGSATSGATMHDMPQFNIAQDEEKHFETVAIALETGERLGSLRWGFAYTLQQGRKFFNATKADCQDAPTAAFERAVEKFYEKRYDAILDGFAPDDATLSTAHKAQLDALLKSNPEGYPVRVGGAADSSEKDPTAISRARADAVATYLKDKGAKVTVVEAYGAEWARVPAAPGTSEAKNRRVQVVVERPP